MKSMKKIHIKYGLMLLMVSLFLLGGVGCSNQPDGKKDSHSIESNETERDTGDNNEEESVLIYASGDYVRINPALDEHGEINSLLFDGLFRYDANNQLVACLAKDDYSFDEATNTYTFHLMEGVQWHDGEGFTAKDVKFTLETIMNPENGSENAPNYEDITEIMIVDNYTIQIQLQGPNVSLPGYLTIAMLPAHLLEGKDIETDEFFRSPIGTGPYKLEQWDIGQSITMVKNKDYFLGEANIDKIIFKIITDDNVKALQMKSGELDLAKLTPKDAAEFKKNDIYKVYSMKTADYRGIMFNFNKELWQKNRDVISALSYAVDRQAILDAVLLGEGSIAYGPLQMNEYNNPNVERYDYNPEKATAELEAAGWVMGSDGFYTKEGEKLTFEITAPEGDQVRVDMTNIAVQQFREIGVDASANITSNVDWENLDTYLIGWGSPFDADDHTYKVFGTDKGANYSLYSNPVVDEFLTKARQTADKEKRMEYYKRFQEEIAKDPAYIFFNYINADYVASSKIKGITSETILGHHGVGIFWNVKDWVIDETTLSK